MSTHRNTCDLLLKANGGDDDARKELWQRVFDELHELAARAMRQERRSHTLQATALVNEAFVRLVDVERDWQNRTHFLAFAAHVIRRILVDHARARGAAKRGGEWHQVTLGEHPADRESAVDVLALEEALEELRNLHKRQSQVVEMRYYAGMTEPEIAQVLAVSRSTVNQDWITAKAFLSARLSSA